MPIPHWEHFLSRCDTRVQLDETRHCKSMASFFLLRRLVGFLNNDAALVRASADEITRKPQFFTTGWLASPPHAFEI